MALRSRGGSHYHECTVCHERVDEGEHIEEIIPAVEATCTAKGKTAGKKCSVCDAILEEQTETDMIAHTPGEEWFVGETGHYHKCTVCETALQEEEHTAGTTYIDGENGKHYQECTACQAKMNEAEHTAGTTYTDDGNGKHYQECTACQAKMNETAHTAGTTYTDDGNGKHYQECTACQAKMNETAHTAGTTYVDDGNGKHYQECTACQAKMNEAAHTAGITYVNGGDGKHYQECTACKAKMNGSEHTITYLYTGDDSNTLDGTTLFTHREMCRICKYEGEDVNCTDSEEWYQHWNNGHTHKCIYCQHVTKKEAHVWAYRPTEGDPNHHDQYCTVCDAFILMSHSSDETQWYSTETGHYRKCRYCEQALEESPHGTNYSNVDWVDMKQHKIKCFTCNRENIVGDHTFRLGSSQPGQTYRLRCTGCDFTVLYYDKLDDGTENFSVESHIGMYATQFRAGCEPFSLTFPSSFTIDGEVKKVTKMLGDNGSSAENCNLTKIVISEGIEKVSGTIQKFQHLTTIVIPEGVKTLYYGQFRDNPSLTTIVLPKSLTEIKNGKSLVYSGDSKPTAYFLGNESEWQGKAYKDGFAAVKYYGTDWHWEDESKKDTPVDGAKPVALLPTMITTTQARKREI